MLTPTLSLDFTTASLNPLITFLRTGATATRVNSSGLVESVAADTARFDFNPVTLACRGLLVEAPAQNLARYSQDFGNAVWTLGNATIGSSTTSPDGTANGQSLMETSATGAHRFFVTSSITATNGTTYTYSVFAKANGRDFVRLSDGNVTGVTCFFNLSTGAVGIVGAGITASSITNFGNGWYRCSISYVMVGTAGAPAFVMSPDGSTVSYAGDITKGVYVWGLQYEAGIGSSYIPTTTAAVTRNADVATITGTNFSDWWQASKGGVLVRARPGTVSGTRPWVQFDDNTADNIIALRGNTTNPELYIVDGGTPQAQIDAGTIAANTDYSMTAWWQTNDCKARLNSGAVVTDTTATIPTVTQARLGSDGTNYLNGHLASMSYYDTFSGQIYTRRKNKAVFSLL